ncbi:hypothetical protein H8E77_21015 [bacterium]|nr:hypothetical protein [bacterium]
MRGIATCLSKEKVGVIIEEGCAILTSAFWEYFDRLSQDDYALLEHLEAHGLLAGATANDLLEALVRARLRLADEHLAFALSLIRLIPRTGGRLSRAATMPCTTVPVPYCSTTNVGNTPFTAGEAVLLSNSVVSSVTLMDSDNKAYCSTGTIYAYALTTTQASPVTCWMKHS